MAYQSQNKTKLSVRESDIDAMFAPKSIRESDIDLIFARSPEKTDSAALRLSTSTDFTKEEALGYLDSNFGEPLDSLVARASRNYQARKIAEPFRGKAAPTEQDVLNIFAGGFKPTEDRAITGVSRFKDTLVDEITPAKITPTPEQRQQVLAEGARVRALVDEANLFETDPKLSGIIKVAREVGEERERLIKEPEKNREALAQIDTFYDEHKDILGYYDKIQKSISELRQREGGDIVGGIKTFGRGLLRLPKVMAAAVLQATQGAEGASVVDKGWSDRFIEDANKDFGKFVDEVAKKYGDKQIISGIPLNITDLAEFPQNLAFSLTSMGAGLVTGIPIALAPLPGARVAAWVAGTAASGKVAYEMTTYQIMQQYLEAKNEEKIQTTGKGISAEEERRLKKEFDSLATEHGLWEAVPEAISNLAFVGILTAPLTKMIGKTIAGKVVSKITALYGQEQLTETVTQMGQTGVLGRAGLPGGREIDWISPTDWIQSFKEVAPQTFLLTTVMAGAGTAVLQTSKIVSSLKGEIGEKHPLFDKLEERVALLTPAELERGLTEVAPTERAFEIPKAPITPTQEVPRTVTEETIDQAFDEAAVPAEPVKPTEMMTEKELPITAVRLKSGEIVSEPIARTHAELVDIIGLKPESIADVGFIVGGRYQSGGVKPTFVEQAEATQRVKAAREKRVEEATRLAGETAVKPPEMMTREEYYQPSENIISKIQKDIKADDDEEAFYGIRRITKYGRKKIKYNVGDELPESYVWDDGTSTGKTLGATSALYVPQTSKELREIMRYGTGDIYLVKGENAYRGQDADEVVLSNARVVQKYSSSKIPAPWEDHESLIREALGEGRPIYEGWQKDYPDLAEKYGKPAEPVKPTKREIQPDGYYVEYVDKEGDGRYDGPMNLEQAESFYQELGEDVQLKKISGTNQFGKTIEVPQPIPTEPRVSPPETLEEIEARKEAILADARINEEQKQAAIRLLDERAEEIGKPPEITEITGEKEISKPPKIMMRVTANREGTGISQEQDVTGWKVLRDGRPNEHGLYLLKSPKGYMVYTAERDVVDKLEIAKPVVVKPPEIQQITSDVRLLRDEKAHLQAISTEGSKVFVQVPESNFPELRKGVVGEVIKPTEDPSGKVGVAHELEGKRGVRFYDATKVSPAEPPQFISEFPGETIGPETKPPGMMRKEPETITEQVSQIRSRYPDTILLVRIGDFFEMIGKDADIGATVLGLKKTKSPILKEQITGFPHHTLETHLPKLLKAGYKIGIVEQLEDPKVVGRLPKRDVIEIISPPVEPVAVKPPEMVTEGLNEIVKKYEDDWINLGLRYKEGESDASFNQRVRNESTKQATDDVLQGFRDLNEAKEHLSDWKDETDEFYTADGTKVDKRTLSDAIKTVESNPEYSPFEGRPITKPAVVKPPEMVAGEKIRDYANTWDRQIKLGRRVQMVMDAGWRTNMGKLSRFGEKTAESKWGDLSPATQNVLRKKIDEHYELEQPTVKAGEIKPPEMLPQGNVSITKRGVGGTATEWTWPNVGTITREQIKGKTFFVARTPELEYRALKFDNALEKLNDYRVQLEAKTPAFRPPEITEAQIAFIRDEGKELADLARGSKDYVDFRNKLGGLGRQKRSIADSQIRSAGFTQRYFGEDIADKERFFDAIKEYDVQKGLQVKPPEMITKKPDITPLPEKEYYDTRTGTIYKGKDVEVLETPLGIQWKVGGKVVSRHTQEDFTRLKSPAMPQARYEEGRKAFGLEKVPKPPAVERELWRMTELEWKEYKRGLVTGENKPDLNAIREAIKEREKGTEEQSLRIIRANPNIVYPDLVERLRIEPSRVGGALRRLKEQGLIDITESQFEAGGLIPSKYKVTRLGEPTEPVKPPEMVTKEAEGLKKVAAQYRGQIRVAKNRGDLVEAERLQKELETLLAKPGEPVKPIETVTGEKNVEWFGIENPILVHNTSVEGKRAIIDEGFSTKRFGATSKEWGKPYKQDPRGISFTLTGEPLTKEELSWKGKGTTESVYSVPQIQNPLVIDFDGWKQKLHDEYKTKGDGRLLTEKLIKKGYDSIITKFTDGTPHEIIVLAPKNLRNFATFEEAKSFAEKPPVEPTERPTLTRNQVREQFRASLPQSVTDEQIDTSIALMDARARSWASEEEGRTAEQWYATHVAGIVQGGGVPESGLFQKREDVAPFFSQLKKSVEELKQEKWLPMDLLRKLANTPGIKPEEMDWTGLRDFLQKATKPVTRQEVVDFLTENEVRVEEVVKGGPVKGIDMASFNEITDIIRANNNLGFSSAPSAREFAYRQGPDFVEGYDWRTPEDKERVKQILSLHMGEKAAVLKYAGYQTPGAKKGTYRELLLMLPYEGTGATVRSPGGVAVPIDPERTFRSPHFNEPNVFAHIRFNERTDSEGKKVLFIEEIQSDWVQRGRREGYDTATFPTYTVAESENGWGVFKDGLIVAEMLDKDRAETRAEEFRNTMGRTPKAIPDMPFKKNWHEVALRRAVRWAAENGFDKVAWTTGEQQAERYDLSKQLETIYYNKNKDGTYSITAKTLDGQNLDIAENIKADKIEDYVGKDIAKKMQEGIGDDAGAETRALRGLDLKVGGEGLKIFYDQILVNYANKFGKKYGAKVSKTRFDFTYLQAIEYGVTEREAKRLKQLEKEGFIVHSLDITPSMRDAVMRLGQPLFQGKKGAVEFLADGRAIIHAFEGANISTLVHESMHLFRRDLNPAQLKIIEPWAGVKDGIWQREHDEKFARAGERYMQEGIAPNERLKPIFQKFKEWLTEIYQSITGSAIDVKISPQVRKVFDELLTEVQLRQSNEKALNVLYQEDNSEPIAPTKAQNDIYVRTLIAELEKERGPRKATERKRPVISLMKDALGIHLLEGMARGLGGNKLVEYVRGGLAKTLRDSDEYKRYSAAGRLQAAKRLETENVNRWVRFYLMEQRKQEASAEIMARDERIATELAQRLVKSMVPLEVVQKLFRLSQKYRTNSDTQGRFFARFWSRVSQMAISYGAAGGELTNRMFEGDIERISLIEVGNTYLDKINDVYDKIDNPFKQDELNEQVVSALEDRVNAQTYLKSEEAKTVFKEAKDLFDHFKKLLEQKGYTVEDDYFTHIRNIDIMDQVLQDIKSPDAAKGKSLNDFITASSPFLKPRMGADIRIRKDVPHVLSSYLRSVTRELAYKDGLQYYYERFQKDVPVALRRNSMERAKVFMKNVLEPERGRGKLFRAINFIRSQQYRNFLGMNLKASAQNFTQPEFARFRWLPEADKLTKKLWRRRTSLTGALADAVDMASLETPRFLELIKVEEETKITQLSELFNRIDTFQASERRNWGITELGSILNSVMKDPRYQELKNKEGQLGAIEEILSNKEAFDKAIREAASTAAETQVASSPSMRGEFYDMPLARVIGMFTAFKFRQLQVLGEALKSQRGIHGTRTQLILRRGLADEVEPVEVLREIENNRVAMEKMLKDAVKYKQNLGVSHTTIGEFISYLKTQETELNDIISKLEPIKGKPRVIAQMMRYYAKVTAISMFFSLLWDTVDMVIDGDDDEEKFIERALKRAFFDILPTPFYGTNPAKFLVSPVAPSLESTVRYGEFSKRGLTRDVVSYATNVIPFGGVIDRATGRRISGAVVDLISPKQPKPKPRPKGSFEY